MVEGDGFENRCVLKGTGGSNPLPSASRIRRIITARCARKGRMPSGNNPGFERAGGQGVNEKGSSPLRHKRVQGQFPYLNDQYKRIDRLIVLDIRARVK